MNTWKKATLLAKTDVCCKQLRKCLPYQEIPARDVHCTRFQDRKVDCHLSILTATFVHNLQRPNDKAYKLRQLIVIVKHSLALVS
jgi:hypothetical protein